MRTHLLLLIVATAALAGCSGDGADTEPTGGQTRVEDGSDPTATDTPPQEGQERPPDGGGDPGAEEKGTEKGRVVTGSADAQWTAGTHVGERIEYLGTPPPAVKLPDGATGLVVEMTWESNPSTETLDLAAYDRGAGVYSASETGGSPLRLVVEGPEARELIIGPHAPENGAFVQVDAHLEWAVFVDRAVDAGHAFG